jgi:hypothetical protein
MSWSARGCAWAFASILILLGCIGIVSAAQPAAAQPAVTHVSHILHFTLHSDGSIPVEPNAMDFAERTNPSGPLLLFLPATGSRPAEYSAFLHTARDVGYHVLGLDYWNRGPSVIRTCHADPECYGQIQQNRFDGADPTVFSHVGRANSIMARLRASLTYLNTNDPDGGWNRFMTGRSINWQDIVLAGHSQGGGESAYIAHQHAVQGVLMFSSPVDTDHGVSATWMNSPGATPPSRMFGFDDTHDVYYTKIVASWKKLGLPAIAGTPDSAVAPTGSHQLISTLDLGDPVQSHLRSVNNDTMRNSTGAPIYQPVWTWMLRQVE